MAASAEHGRGHNNNAEPIFSFNFYLICDGDEVTIVVWRGRGIADQHAREYETRPGSYDQMEHTVKELKVKEGG